MACFFSSRAARRRTASLQSICHAGHAAGRPLEDALVVVTSDRGEAFGEQRKLRVVDPREFTDAQREALRSLGYAE